MKINSKGLKGLNIRHETCKKRRGKKEPTLWTIDQGLLLGSRSPAELPGAGKQGSEGGLRSKGGLGTKGSLRGSLRGEKESAKSVRVGKGFIAWAGPPI